MAAVAIGLLSGAVIVLVALVGVLFVLIKRLRLRLGDLEYVIHCLDQIWTRAVTDCHG